MPLLRRRRPLLRAAAVGGGAYALGKHAQRADADRQDQAYAAGQESAMAAAPPPPPAQPAGLSAADFDRLAELGKLHDQGILTDEEFAQQKAIILGTG